MRILVVGATGFLGERIVAAAVAAGHDVLRGQRDAGGQRDVIAVDYTRDLDPADWARRLRGVDVVVNAVGILREHGAQTFAALHERGPAALFAGCVSAGVRKVVQISALGAERDAASLYHRSKAAADAALAALPIRWVIVQPSLVFGAGGASATLFCALATLPVVPVPGAGGQRVQPIHVDDLVCAVMRLVARPDWDGQRIAVVGPAPLALRELLAAVRAELGLPPARFMHVPMSVVRAAAGLGRLRRDALLDADTLGMLVRGNVASSDTIAAVLGRPPRPPGQFVTPSDSRALATAGRLAWLLPLTRWAIAIVWLASGVVSLGLYPVESSYELLARVGIVGSAAPLVLYGAAVLDIALGLASLLLRRRRWLWRLQIAVIAGYSAIIAFALPEFWLHPFGPLVKNLPMLAGLALLHELDEPR